MTEKMQNVFKRRDIVWAACIIVVFIVVLSNARAEEIQKLNMAQLYINSLGMKFVPIPNTNIMMSVYETRVRDYAAYARENSGVYEEWKDPISGFSQSEDHPVLCVSWEDAQAFCKWLTQKEKHKGIQYRLPTDHEWSMAVGIGDRERASDSPAHKNAKIKGVYVWGAAWPPPQGAGNYSQAIENDTDVYEYTAPVGKFKSNRYGLYDMGGNVREWCQDLYTSNTDKRVLRGGSYGNRSPDALLASCRGKEQPSERDDNYGFRCVIQTLE
ncbi:MAG: SUMF1/EgtB/PvdO family nonheme iron enzyme [Verrucomicrobiota bacterium]